MISSLYIFYRQILTLVDLTFHFSRPTVIWVIIENVNRPNHVKQIYLGAPILCPLHAERLAELVT